MKNVSSKKSTFFKTIKKKRKKNAPAVSKRGSYKWLYKHGIHVVTK